MLFPPDVSQLFIWFVCKIWIRDKACRKSLWLVVICGLVSHHVINDKDVHVAVCSCRWAMSSKAPRLKSWLNEKVLEGG